jgi:hypothetical protein
MYTGNPRDISPYGIESRSNEQVGAVPIVFGFCNAGHTAVTVGNVRRRDGFCIAVANIGSTEKQHVPAWRPMCPNVKENRQSRRIYARENANTGRRCGALEK